MIISLKLLKYFNAVNKNNLIKANIAYMLLN